MNTVYCEATRTGEHERSCENAGARPRGFKDFMMEIAVLAAVALTLAVVFSALVFLPAGSAATGGKTETHIALTSELSTEATGVGQ